MDNFLQVKNNQSGSVIIMTLWTITLITILVTVIASQVKLSARVVFFHQQELGTWSNILAASNQAEMELMMERMPRPAETIEDLSEIDRNPLYRYNGQELELNYEASEDIVVRIYDHAGKINLREIGLPRLRVMFEKMLGEEQDEEIDDLLAVWIDWLDSNDAADLNGAESDYYESFDTPYYPRNGTLETVEEILHIRGFDEIFAGINLDAAFTLYTEDVMVNLNLATVEAMRLLPGLDEELIEQIVLFRRDNDFRNNGDIANLIPAENMVMLRPWINSRKTSDYYTIMINSRQNSTEEELSDTSTTAYSEIVEIRSFTQKPRILKIDPYANIPVRLKPIEEELTL